MHLLRLTGRYRQGGNQYNLREEEPEFLAEGHINSNDQYGWFPLNVQAIVNLTLGEGVGAKLIEGSIHEDGADDHLVTAFGGFLINPSYI